MSAAAECRDEDLEAGIDALMQSVYDTHGYDFRNYARASRRRRVLSFLESEGLDSPAEAARRLLTDEALFQSFLSHLTISTTELFRNPGFYRDFVRLVLPVLATYPGFKLWHAGCSTGEEVYSMAILLHEHNLLRRATIYATDVDRSAVGQAKKGIVRSQVLKRDSANYFNAGMLHSLHDYWHTRHGYSLLDADLLENVVFSEHNLSTDTHFCEMQVILCRNVLIYFDKSLQGRVLRLLAESLSRSGFLCLGAGESLRFSEIEHEMSVVSAHSRIYRKRAVL